MTPAPPLPPRPAYQWQKLRRVGGTFAVPYTGKPRPTVNRLNAQCHERFGKGGYSIRINVAKQEVRVWRKSLTGGSNG